MPEVRSQKWQLCAEIDSLGGAADTFTGMARVEGSAAALDIRQHVGGWARAFPPQPAVFHQLLARPLEPPRIGLVHKRIQPLGVGFENPPPHLLASAIPRPDPPRESGATARPLPRPRPNQPISLAAAISAILLIMDQLPPAPRLRLNLSAFQAGPQRGLNWPSLGPPARSDQRKSRARNNGQDAGLRRPRPAHGQDLQRWSTSRN